MVSGLLVSRLTIVRSGVQRSTNPEDGRQEPPSCRLRLQLLRLMSGRLTDNHLMDIPMRFVAAEAGFFPPGPFTLLADILAYGKDV